MIYYISDTHFYHENIIKLCNRPFNSVKEMNSVLITKWNNKVKPEDEIYFLGDFSHKCSLEQSVEIIKNLNGKKYFIKGNHDSDELVAVLLENKLIEWAKDYFETVDNNRKVVLCHYPIEDWNGEYNGSYHLFGHIHNNTKHNYRVFDRRFNVSCEILNYEPKSLDELIDIFNK